MQANQYIPHDEEDRVVPLTGQADPQDNWIQEHLNKLFEHFTQTNAEFDGRLDRLHSRAQHLEARTNQLESQANSVASSVEALNTETAAIRSSVCALEEKAESTESKLDATGSEVRSIGKTVGSLADRTQSLETAARDLSEVDKRQAVEHSVLRDRVADLEPRQQELENTSKQLLRDTGELKNDTDRLDDKIKWGAWGAGATALVLAGALGYTFWSGVSAMDGLGSSVEDRMTEVTGKIQRIESGQMHAAALEQKVDTLQRQVDLKVIASSEMLSEYDGLTKDVESLDDRLTVTTEGLQGELAVIKERIYASDENPVGAKVDLASLRDSSWLAGQDSAHFVIQLVNVYRKSDLADFIGRFERHLPLGELSYYKTVHRGRDMFVLLYGNYASFGKAMSQLEAFPGGVQRNKPFLRTIGSVQRTAL